MSQLELLELLVQQPVFLGSPPLLLHHFPPLILIQHECNIRQTQITFYGYRFDQEGFKVQAIYECEPPMSKSEVIRFLGVAGYQSMFIPRYASLPKPLKDLTRPETKIQWDQRNTKHLRKLRGPLKARTQYNFSTANYQLWYVWRLATMRGYQRFSSSNLHRDPKPGPSPCLLWAASQKSTLWSTGTAGGLQKRAALTQRLSRRRRRCRKDALPLGFSGMEWVAEMLLQALA